MAEVEMVALMAVDLVVIADQVHQVDSSGDASSHRRYWWSQGGDDGAGGNDARKFK
jgi:hypothetical protein